MFFLPLKEPIYTVSDEQVLWKNSWQSLNFRWSKRLPSFPIETLLFVLEKVFIFACSTICFNTVTVYNKQHTIYHFYVTSLQFKSPLVRMSSFVPSTVFFRTGFPCVSVSVESTGKERNFRSYNYRSTSTVVTFTDALYLLTFLRLINYIIWVKCSTIRFCSKNN